LQRIESMPNERGGETRGLEPDFAPGTSRSYHGGSFVDQANTRRAGPYVGMGPKGYRRSDESLYDDACQRLTAFGDVDAREIEVKVARGEVTLSGWVADLEQKRLAEAVVDGVPGVIDIHNRLQMRPAPTISPTSPTLGDR
jgi:osmotically-inducible protein OsmY